MKTHGECQESTIAQGRVFRAHLWKGTEKSYGTGWRKWSSWCSGRGGDPVNPSAAMFLTDEFKLGKSYSKLNSYRSD